MHGTASREQPGFPIPAHDGLHRLRLVDGRRAICKRRRDMPAGFFAAEAAGLQALAGSNGLRVPELYALGDDHIVVEDLGQGSPASDYRREAGRGLARQHATTGERFGFGHEGWCGDSPQDNTPDEDGHRFFAERRLLPQARRALDAGRLGHAEVTAIEALCKHLPELVPPQPPVLLHGDLWSGNLHCDENGAPALIDPGAVHYGWAEAELAMLTLFGPLPPSLFASYAEHAPLAADWRERAPVYNLYHLLNHLNLFGSGYLAAVRRVLRRFG